MHLSVRDIDTWRCRDMALLSREEFYSRRKNFIFTNMKRTLIDKINISLPASLSAIVGGYPIYDSSCSPEARVYFIDRGEGLYLKIGKSGTLGREAEITKYFHSIGYGTEILDYISGENDFLLSRRMIGEDCTHEEYLREPKRLATLIGEKLRILHETDFSGCPIQNKLSEYIEYAEKRYEADDYDKSNFPDSFGYSCAEDAISVLRDGKGELRCDTLLHGDYCLPNIMLDNWKLSGFIDLGGGGVGDRHIDLFWGAWTLMFNLGTDKYRNTFFDADGTDKIDLHKIEIVAAAEVFG